MCELQSFEFSNFHSILPIKGNLQNKFTMEIWSACKLQ